MKIPPLAFKIAAQLIQQQLDSPANQAAEPADLPVAPQLGGSVLSLLGKEKDRATATEPAPKVVTDSGKPNV